jgi:hypothetical protein
MEGSILNFQTGGYVRSGLGKKTRGKKKKKKPSKGSAPKNQEPDENLQPIQWIEWPTGALVHCCGVSHHSIGSNWFYQGLFKSIIVFIFLLVHWCKCGTSR